MAKCILHVGMSRTGTKSIQQSLKSLDDDGFYYARLRDQPNHSVSIPIVFANQNAQRPPRKLGLKQDDDPAAISNQCRNDLRSSIKTAGGRTLVISGEGILRMPPADLKRLKAFLAREGYDTEVIGYVREPMAYIQGVVQQRIKHGNASAMNIAEAMPRYKESFSKFDDIFGAGNVRLFKFDETALAGNDVVLDFCSKTGIPKTSIKPVRRNEAITRLTAQLVFQLVTRAKSDGLERITPQVSLALCNRLRSLESPPFRMAPSTLRPYLENIADDIAWMEERLGASLPGDHSERTTDIASESDLLAPVPGADDRLRILLREDGDVSDHSGLDSPALLRRLAERAKDNARGPDRGRARNPEAGPAVAPAAARKAPDSKQPDNGVRPQAERQPAPKPSKAGQVSAQPKGAGRPLARPPLLATPRILLNKDKNLMVLWSPKSACTTVYVWFSHISGFSNDVKSYAAWPHRHRLEQFMKSPLYAESVKNGMDGATALRIIRDPYGRAVSIYRHALQTHFADEDMSAFSGNRIDADAGYSFQTFLDLLESIAMPQADIHFRPQFHPYEETRKADHVINISKSDLFVELNKFEEATGLPRTDFADLHWLHTLERKRKASQEPMRGDALDEMPFSRAMAIQGSFPSYAQLLTPRARQRIEAIYKADFDAYHEYL